MGLGIGGVYLLTRRQTPQTVYIPTGNVYRDSKAQQILSIAQQAAMSAAQIAALIQKINGSSDSQLDAIRDQVAGGQLYA